MPAVGPAALRENTGGPPAPAPPSRPGAQQLPFFSMMTEPRTEPAPHPFTAPDVRPAINSFCSRRNSASTGAIEISVPDMIRP